jgi:glycosyltransferase involved in cell wall biosynthesis
MEALAAGLPLVVSELHAISKYLRNGEDSLFFKPSDTPDLRKKIGLLLSDETMRKIFSTNSIETARKYFDHKIRINEEADLLIGYL